MYSKGKHVINTALFNVSALNRS